MKKSQFKERELDLNDLFWKLLEQWKGIVLAGLVLAVLLSSAMVIKNHREAKKTVDVNPDVLNAVSLYADYMDKREHYESNFFNKVDLNKCITITCLYEFNPANKTYSGDDEAILAAVNNMYNQMLSEGTFRTEMINELKKYWPEIDSNTFGIVMNSTAIHSVVYGPGTITINITIPDNGDPEELQSALTASVYAYHDRIAESVSQENTIKLLSFVYKQTDYTTELTARNSRYSLVSAGNSQYRNAYNSLDKDTQKTIDDALKECGNSSDPSVYEEYLQKKAKSSAVSTRSLLIRYFVLGLIAGVALYIFMFVAYIIVIRRVRTDSELENATGIRNFGGIYEYPYTGFIQKLLHDRKIYNYRTRNGRSIGRICDDMKSKLDFSGKNAYTLVTLGKLSDRARAITDEQISLMKEGGITVETLHIDNGPGAIEDSVFAGLGSVVIQLLGNRTKWMDLADLYSKLNEYNVDIIGSEYIDA